MSDYCTNGNCKQRKDCAKSKPSEGMNFISVFKHSYYAECPYFECTHPRWRLYSSLKIKQCDECLCKQPYGILSH